MSKVVTSPSKQWPGTVTLKKPLMIPEAELIEDALNITIEEDGHQRLTPIDKKQIPAVLACVEKWELSDFPADPTEATWPISPRIPSRQLIQWIFNEILMIYMGEVEIPNE